MYIRQIPPPPYDYYVIEDYKAIVLEEAEKLYNVLVDQLVCEVINEDVSKQLTGATPSLPELSFGGAMINMRAINKNDIFEKYKQ